MRKRAFLLAAGAVFLVSASATPHFSVLDASCSENGPCTVKWTKSVKASSYSYLSFSSADLTAKRDVDYRAVSTSMTVGNNTLSGIVAAAVIPRPGYQGNRTFRLHMVATRYGIVDRADAVVTIIESEAPPPAPTLTKCADEGGLCSVAGTPNVRYGAGSNWTAFRTVTGSIPCDNATWGDPIVGTVKACWTDGQVAAPAPTPTPDPTPLPAPQPTPTGNWVTAPLAIGGYAYLRNQSSCCNGLIVKIVAGGITSDADPARRQHWWGFVFYSDTSGNYPSNLAYWRDTVLYGFDEGLAGIAPQ